MKQFLIRCLALFLAAAACIWLIGAAYQHTNTFRNYERSNEIERFEQVPKGIDIAVVGASHGMLGFLYAPEDAVFFNFCLSAQTPQYDLRMLREYGDRLKPGAVVLITVSYMSPFWTEPENTFLWKQGRYYHVLSAGNMIDPDLSKWVLGRLSPVLTTDFHTVALAFLKDAGLNPTYNESSGLRAFDPADIPADQGRVMNDHITALISPTFPECNPDALGALEDTLALCQERGWQAVLVSPPYLEAYNQVFAGWDNEFYPRFYGYINGLSSRFGVPYLDYSHDDAFAERYDCYKDMDHMNLEGAKIFDALLYADLKALLGEDFPFSDTLTDLPFNSN